MARFAAAAILLLAMGGVLLVAAGSPENDGRAPSAPRTAAAEPPAPSGMLSEPPGVSRAGDRRASDKPLWQAAWAFRPDDLEDLADDAEALFEGTVMAIRPGPAMAESSVPIPDPHDIPTQRVVFRVDDVVYGELGDEVVLFKAGDDDGYFEGDPPYQVGERYLMFVGRRNTPPGTYLNWAPDGRLKVKNGKLEPFVGGMVADKLKGQPKDTVKAAAKAAKKEAS